MKSIYFRVRVKSYVIGWDVRNPRKVCTYVRCERTSPHDEGHQAYHSHLIDDSECARKCAIYLLKRDVAGLRRLNSRHLRSVMSNRHRMSSKRGSTPMSINGVRVRAHFNAPW